jgi:2-iminobutanoate/2-iminopropanoate deaminase
MDIVGPPLTGPTGTILPLSQAVSVGELVFVSGQVALRDGQIVGRDVAEQTEIVFDGIASILTMAGLTLADVAKTTVWLARAADFGEFNRVYAARFGDWRPARSTVVSGLIFPEALVEIEVVATRRATTPGS